MKPALLLNLMSRVLLCPCSWAWLGILIISNHIRHTCQGQAVHNASADGLGLFPHTSCASVCRRHCVACLAAASAILGRYPVLVPDEDDLLPEVQMTLQHAILEAPTMLQSGCDGSLGLIRWELDVQEMVLVHVQNRSCCVQDHLQILRVRGPHCAVNRDEDRPGTEKYGRP